jgi:hypothetical protein
MFYICLHHWFIIVHKLAVPLGWVWPSTKDDITVAVGCTHALMHTTTERQLITTYTRTAATFAIHSRANISSCRLDNHHENFLGRIATNWEIGRERAREGTVDCWEGRRDPCRHPGACRVLPRSIFGFKRYWRPPTVQTCLPHQILTRQPSRLNNRRRICCPYSWSSGPKPMGRSTAGLFGLARARHGMKLIRNE